MHRHLTAAVVIVLLVVAIGCNTAKRVKQQHLALLDAEVSYLTDVNSLLTRTPDPERNSTFGIFVSASTLDGVLKAADGYEAPIPSIKNAILRVNSIRTQFDNGLPALAIDAEARRAQLRIKVIINVEIQPQFENTELRLVAHVRSAVPQASWKWYQLGTYVFVNDLLKTTLDSWAKALPVMSIPLNQSFALKVPTTVLPTTAPTQGGSVDGQVTIPGLTGRQIIAVEKVLFLKDGVHLFCSVRQG